MSLTTTWLGLSLKNPLVASASPMNRKLDNLRLLEDSGAGAVVLPSLFQEQIEAETESFELKIDSFSDCSPEARSYFPAALAGPYGFGPDRYLELVRRARKALAIPVIASLNGSSLSGWTEYARLIEQAGAMAVELNMVHVPYDLTESGQDVEARYGDIVQAVCQSVTIPVSVKLTPFLSSMGHFAGLLAARGAAGLVLFNRLLEPDIDMTRMKLADRLTLSTQDDMRLPMQWTALLSGRVKTSLAASGGVTVAEDVIKYLLAGADVVMTTSALMRNEARYMKVLVDGLRDWMAERGFTSLAEFRGLMNWQRNAERGVYARANYLQILAHSAAT